MFCKKCGSQLPDDAKFCKKCGTPTKVSMNSSEEQASKSVGKRIRKTIGWILLIIVLIIGVLLLLDYIDIIDSSMMNRFMTTTEVVKEVEEDDDVEDVIGMENVKIEHPNADEYYENNSTIISEIVASDSVAVQTEKEVKVSIEERGFVDYPISFEYSMEGEYGEATNIDMDSSDMHPMYQTFYLSSNDELWTIFVINDSVVANPVSYNMQSDKDVPVLFSESETVTSYDSVTNKFYKIIPNESEAIVKVVDNIDAKTLDSLTIEVIDGL